MSSGLADRNGDCDWVRPGDRLHRDHLALLRRAFRNADLGDRRVLEIGSGRGGNCYYLSSYAGVRRLVGVDSSVASTRAAGRVCGDGVRFVGGDIAALPFRDRAFDVVLNVEGSPFYPDRRTLLAEVARVLTPGGVFVYMDIFPRDEEALAAASRDASLDIESDEDVTEEAFQALRRPDGLEALLREIVTEANRDLVRDILQQRRSIAISLALGRTRARIVRLVRRAPGTPRPRPG